MVAREQMRHAVEVRKLVDESHLSIWLLECPDCGQPYVHVFTELIDWVDSEDSQSVVYCRLNDREVERLLTEDGDPVEDRLVKLDIHRRMLWWINPKGCEPLLEWRESPLIVLPHD